MAPTALPEQPSPESQVEGDMAKLKERLAHGFAFSNGTVPPGVELKKVERKVQRHPVKDDWMYDFKYNADLPVLSKDVLSIDDAEAVPLATEFVEGLEKAFADPEVFAGLFIEQGGTYLPVTADRSLTSRRLARQGCLHVGIPYLQLPLCDPQGRE